MSKVFYKPKNGWVGDLIPFSHNGKFYLYYLHDERKGKTVDEYGFGTSWNLLNTEDGATIQDIGVALAPGGEDDVDLSCYTGSVIEGTDGVFHMFYTAQNSVNPKYSKEGKPLQYVMQATSKDLITWEKHYDSVMGADGNIYEIFDWRDPYVFYDDDEKCYIMLLAARLQGASQKNGGCIGMCKSLNLWNWEVCEPFYNPETYMTHECPDVFKMGDWWYLVYSTFSERFVTHYRMAKDLKGPWIAPIEDSFDGRAFYAAKTAEKNGERWAFAWVPTKRGDDDFGQWDWGGSLIMHKLVQHADGRLLVEIPPEIKKQFSKCEKLVTTEQGFNENSQYTIKAEDRAMSLRFKQLPKHCLIEADIKFDNSIRNFGIAIRQDNEYANGYYFRLEPFYNRIVFDLWPRRIPGVNQWYIDGEKPFVLELERPFNMCQINKVHLRLVVDGDICSLYVNNSVALTTRTYKLEESNWSFFAFDGNIDISNINVFTK